MGYGFSRSIALNEGNNSHIQVSYSLFPGSTRSTCLGMKKIMGGRTSHERPLLLMTRSPAMRNPLRHTISYSLPDKFLVYQPSELKHLSSLKISQVNRVLVSCGAYSTVLAYLETSYSVSQRVIIQSNESSTKGRLL